MMINSIRTECFTDSCIAVLVVYEYSQYSVLLMLWLVYCNEVWVVVVIMRRGSVLVINPSVRRRRCVCVCVWLSNL